MTMTVAQGCQLAHGPADWHWRTRVLVVGSGVAGLTAARDLCRADVPTMVITRGSPTESSTDWAQGGLAAVWSDEDSFRLHADDTMAAGAGLCAPGPVHDLVVHAPGALHRLITAGARFDSGPDGRIDLHLEGGHHARRILHAGGDRSGREVHRVLLASLPSGGAEVRGSVRVVDVLTDVDGAVCGVRALDGRGRSGVIRARIIVLATGGIAALWPTSTNPPVCAGDGLAAALRAGATARDVEFLQFHPTVLVPPRRRPGDRGVLVSEAVRGDGAVLVDHEGVRVMQGAHPLADLAPRDVVSAAEHAHMRRTGESHLFLDATRLGAAGWRERFPSILRMCRERGVDPVTEPIPVRPGAHYHCGGIRADMTGRTGVPGLYVIGEAACTGVQGANRLASNSLIEGLIMGERAAREISGLPLGEAGDECPRPTTGLVPGPWLEKIRSGLADCCGVVRSEPRLTRMRAVLDDCPRSAARLTHESLSATNAALVAGVLTAAARTRTESRGAHRREDFPCASPQWRHHLDWHLNENGSPRCRAADRTPAEVLPAGEQA
ncbi:FAD-binding protein [uncultured Propionibacterium sp.]|uniref:L-aspartate oxidase n=1 Tax=uncultured Propionibacterium sp. TaxID=218066 RepID=UPI0029312979|nr:FAD-binding protein [uncultured Propionibacterium sp.]